MVFDLVELQHLPYITIDKGCVIVADNLVGAPNLTIMFSLMKFATAPPVAFRSGTAFTHLVKYFVATSIHMYPLDGGLTGPTKLSPQVWKAHGITILCKFCG